MGKSKNKVCRIGVRLTQDEKNTLNDILEYRSIGISEFLIRAIELESAKVRKEKNNDYINNLINSSNSEF